KRPPTARTGEGRPLAGRMFPAGRRPAAGVPRGTTPPAGAAPRGGTAGSRSPGWARGGGAAEVAADGAGLLGGPAASAALPGRRGGGLPEEAADGADGRRTATGRPDVPGGEAARGRGA